jgi:uncharacterized protein
MIPLKFRLSPAARDAGVPQDVVEKDYALSYVLAGVAASDHLRDHLVLKGGTALKKLYFGEYRFSEDLDFSTHGAPPKEVLEDALSLALQTARELLATYGPFEISLQRYEEREPHPHGQEAFAIRVRFPWHRESLCRIKVEVTTDEPVLLAPERRRVLHGYGEKLECYVSCYALEEIVAEKLRTLLQTHQKLATRGWNRARARDYYDLWRIFRDYGAVLRVPLIPDVLRHKASRRHVAWRTIDDFFTEELTREASRTWDGSLGPFVSDLPECALVLSQLRESLSPVLQ